VEEIHAADDEDWEALAIPSAEEPAEAPLDTGPLSGTEVKTRESHAGPIASSDQGADKNSGSNAKATPQLAASAKFPPPDEEEGMSSMFDEDNSEAGLPESVTLLQRQAQMEEPLLAWGTDPGPGKSQLPGGKKKGPANGGGDVQRQPKALLQQHCQKQGWPAPRFEKLPAGGERIETGGYRYSVTVERPGRGKGKKGSTGPLQAQLPADEDGYGP
jgi:ATP-dependent RNA helicase DHX29